MSLKNRFRSLSNLIRNQSPDQSTRGNIAGNCPSCGAPWAGEALQCVQCGVWRVGSNTREADGMFTLVFINSSDGAPWEYPIPSMGQLRIGRAEDNEVHLPHSLVSRRHASVWFDGSTYWLQDEGSLNGTLVNGRPMAGTKPIQRGDTIEIGDTIFYLLAPGDPVPNAPDPDQLAWATGDDWVSWGQGYQLGRYQLLRELGKGGMATVWQARSPDFTDDIVVKIMNPDLLDDPEYSTKFWTEAEVGRRLHHPNIVKAYRFERNFNPPFIVMEYVHDILPSKLRRQANRLSVDETVPVVTQICDALAHAHELDVVHRDVKPGNIFVQANGVAKLGDFGVAKVMTRSLTRAGSIWGTYKYMPPEQVRGDPIDHRVDIYALGVVMYELLTGQPPFISDDPRRMAEMHIYSQVVPPRQLNPAIPTHIENAIMHALEKDPRHRFQSALEMRSAIGVTHFPPPPTNIWAAHPILEIISGERQGNIIPLDQSGLILRRQDLDRRENTISRQHARVFWKEGRYWVADLDSANGTYVNEAKVIYPVALKNGDLIRLGKMELVFEW